MNRGISAVHRHGDAPPLDAPFSRMSHGRLLAKALQRLSGSRSLRVRIRARSRPVRARHPTTDPTPLRAEVDRPDARTGLRLFLRPREPTATRPLGRSASRRIHRQAEPSYRRLPPAFLARKAAVNSPDEPSAIDPDRGDRSPAGEELPVARGRSAPSGRHSLRPMNRPGPCGLGLLTGGGDNRPVGACSRLGTFTRTPAVPLPEPAAIEARMPTRVRTGEKLATERRGFAIGRSGINARILWGEDAIAHKSSTAHPQLLAPPDGGNCVRSCGQPSLSGSTTLLATVLAALQHSRTRRGVRRSCGRGNSAKRKSAKLRR